jgi:cephalosporin-C deacetylase-like acetyl esterase
MMKRRQFLASSLTSTALLPAGKIAAKITGQGQEMAAKKSPTNLLLDETESGVRHLDSLIFSQALYADNVPTLSFRAKGKKSALAWQRECRKTLQTLVGNFPNPRVALNAQILEKKDFETYTREKIIFQSRKNLSVVGYLLLPRKFSRPGPAVICLPGHGRGCDDIVGIEVNGKQRSVKSGYQMDFAVQTVERGFAALAIEPLGFGHRRDAAARKKGPEQSSCQPIAGAALLLGQTMVGWRVWDVMRAIDYLQTRPEIDGQRIATMGISGGGTVSLFSAALDQRIKVSVVSGYFNTFRDSIMSISHCMDNYVPGILNYVEMYDIAGLVAPRALFIESGTKDNIFPIEASKHAFHEAQRIYEAFAVPEKISQEIFSGEHMFHGTGAFAFLQTQL